MVLECGNLFLAPLKGMDRVVFRGEKMVTDCILDITAAGLHSKHLTLNIAYLCPVQSALTISDQAIMNVLSSTEESWMVYSS